MFLDTLVKPLFEIPIEMIDDFSRVCNSVNWSAPEMTRTGDSLISRTVRIPFGRRRDPYQEATPQVQEVQQQFARDIGPWLTEQFADQILFKGEINYLFPGMILPFHIDACWFHEHGSRIHIPIDTNPQAFWATETELIHMPAGFVYEVNNRIMHSFWNRGSQGRLHIVIDIINADVYEKAVQEQIDMNLLTTDPNLTAAEVFIQRNQWCP